MAKIGYETVRPAVSANVFSRDRITELSLRLGEPEWMLQKRLLAWSLYRQLPLPAKQDPGWRRTDLSSLGWAGLGSLPVEPVLDVTRRALPVIGHTGPAVGPDAGQVAGLVRLVNGQPVVVKLDDNLRRQGVVFTDLSTAVREWPELVRKHFMAQNVLPGSSKLAAQHAAFWDGGTLLYVPRGVGVRNPFHVQHYTAGEDVSVLPHTLVVTDPWANVTLVEEYASIGDGDRSYNNAVVEIVAADGAAVTYLDFQDWGRQVFNLNTRSAILAPASAVTWHTAQLGARITKTEVDTLLAGDGSTSRFSGIFLADGEQHMDLGTLAHHVGLGTRADLLLKGAASDSARAVLQGKIKINPGAQRTDSYLKNDNLLLDRRARVDTIPALEIDANDVRASHGATVSRVDEDQVFYLQSRGVPRPAAIRLITEGFFASVYDLIEVDWFRERLAAAVAAKIGG